MSITQDSREWRIMAARMLIGEGKQGNDRLIKIQLRHQIRHRFPKRILPIRHQQLDEQLDFLDVTFAGADTGNDDGDKFDVLDVEHGCRWGPGELRKGERMSLIRLL